MDSISEEIQQLQLKILELEKIKKEKDENDKKSPITNNFKIIDDLLIEKKLKIIKNNYSKSVPLARFYDEERVKYLEAIYNILQILNERLIKLEQNIL